jgi:hypothetical protein
MRFLRELRQMRSKAGLEPAELAAKAHYPDHVIVAAEAGPALPDLPVLSAYVRGCGEGIAEWEERWRFLTGAPAAPVGLPARPVGTSSLAAAGARAGSATPAVDLGDPERIMAAISRTTAAAAIPVQARSAPLPADPAPAGHAPVSQAPAGQVTPGPAESSRPSPAPDGTGATPPEEARASRLPAVAAPAHVVSPAPRHPAVRPAAQVATRGASGIPRAALAATVAAVVFVVGAILMLLRRRG